MNTYAKLMELEQRVAALEARLTAQDDAGDTIGSAALEDAATEMREAADAILDASKPRRKR